jgi:hypothetical protein
MVPLGNSEEESQKAALDLASSAATELPAFVPN